MNDRVDILKTPVIDRNIEYKPFKTTDEVLQKMIDTFTITIETNVQEDNLRLFKSNISTLKVANKGILLEQILGLFKDNTVTGLYYLEDNMISVLPLQNKQILNKYLSISTEEYIANLYHELLHMASTVIDGNMIFSGFSQIGNTNVGIAIDDAYTEILLYRYFSLSQKYLSYDYEVTITTLIEEIIGQNKMTNLYFNANLYDLVRALEKYNTKENIFTFLENLDSIYVLRDHSKKYRKDVIYYHNEIANFLVNTYVNKLRYDYREKREYDYKLDTFLNSIHMAFKLLEVERKSKIREK